MDPSSWINPAPDPSQIPGSDQILTVVAALRRAAWSAASSA